MSRRFSRSNPEPDGPKPFSEDWVTTPSSEIERSSRKSGWFPSERLVAAAALIGLILLLVVPFRNIGGVNRESPPESIPAVAAASSPTPISVPTVAVASTLPTATETPGAADVVVAVPTVAATTPALALGEAVLPANRILSFYGFPGVGEMGILGEYDMAPLLDLLRAQAAEYEAVDPSRPVVLALEVIASVAQAYEGADGDHLAYINTDVLQSYIDFTAENDMLLILDMQFGRKSVQEEMDFARPYLLYPHVHLALDPEFAVGPDEIPATVIGSIDAVDVMYAQNELATIAAENGLPPKILIVHQFTLSSISNRDQIVAVEGVQFVLEVDGFGTPDEKRGTYAVISRDLPEGFVGFKLWYRQDVPLMTPAEVLALDPSPDLIIYQ